MLFFVRFFHLKDMSSIYDIIIIGGGIVGLGVFQQITLNGYKNVLLVDKSSQILTGASSGNSGILHTGFDTIPQTLESKLVKRGYEMYQSFARDIELPIKKIGAYIIAWTTDELEILKEILDTAHKVNDLFLFVNHQVFHPVLEWCD
jgi:glycerol-3-phosphate dehydrogenase